MSDIHPDASSWTWIDGEIVPTESASIGVLDRGFLYGESVFETLRTVQRMGLFLSDHLQRFRNSASRLGMAVDFDDCWMEQLLDTMLARLPGEVDAVVRITMTRGDRIDGRLDGDGCRPRLIVTVTALAPELPILPVHLVISKYRKAPPEVLDPTIKSGNFLSSVRAREDAIGRGADDGILLSPDGILTETSCANLFWVRDGAVFTCSRDLVLEGITRAWAIRWLQSSGTEVIEGLFPELEIRAAQEAFLTSSVSGIVPVASIDGHDLTSDQQTSIATKLAAQYQHQIHTPPRGSVR
ncbi:MAG: aminotransferase class IV [Planctomycetota bacterium]|nr:aminotransferase class IV [Planctomycetota bacterium]